MQITIINENNIECILDKIEMEEFELTLEDLKENSTTDEGRHKISDRMLAVVEHIKDELEKEGTNISFIENSMMAIEARVLSNDTLKLIIKIVKKQNIANDEEIDDYEELEDEELEMFDFMDNNGSNFPDMLKNFMAAMVLEEMLHRERMANENNNSHNQSNMLNSQQETITKNQTTNLQKNNNIINNEHNRYSKKCLKFNTLNEVIEFCKLFPIDCLQKSILYKNNSDYYLFFSVFGKQIEQDKITYYINEFYVDKEKEHFMRTAYIEEHFEKIIKTNAIETLKKF